MARLEPDNFAQNTVVLCSVENEIEAQLIEGALSEQGIACMVDRSHDTAYDGLFIPAKGWARVLVLEGELEEARRVVERLSDGLSGQNEADIGE